jgi:hypothetical protein
VAEVWGQYGNPEERERPALEAGTRTLVKTVTADTNVCVCVCNCYLYSIVTSCDV